MTTKAFSNSKVHTRAMLRQWVKERDQLTKTAPHLWTIDATTKPGVDAATGLRFYPRLTSTAFEDFRKLAGLAHNIDQTVVWLVGQAADEAVRQVLSKKIEAVNNRVSSLANRSDGSTLLTLLWSAALIFGLPQMAAARVATLFARNRASERLVNELARPAAWRPKPFVVADSQGNSKDQIITLLVHERTRRATWARFTRGPRTSLSTAVKTSDRRLAITLPALDNRVKQLEERTVRNLNDMLGRNERRSRANFNILSEQMYKNGLRAAENDAKIDSVLRQMGAPKGAWLTQAVGVGDIATSTVTRPYTPPKVAGTDAAETTVTSIIGDLQNAMQQRVKEKYKQLDSMIRVDGDLYQGLTDEFHRGHGGLRAADQVVALTAFFDHSILASEKHALSLIDEIFPSIALHIEKVIWSLALLNDHEVGSEHLPRLEHPSMRAMSTLPSDFTAGKIVFGRATGGLVVYLAERFGISREEARVVPSLSYPNRLQPVDRDWMLKGGGLRHTRLASDWEERSLAVLVAAELMRARAATQKVSKQLDALLKTK